MSAYLTRLVERARGGDRLIEPRLRASFEPSPQTSIAGAFTNEGSSHHGIEAEAGASATRRWSPDASNAEVAKVSATGSDVEPEPALVPLTVNAHERPALARIPRGLGEHSPEPARGTTTAAHAESTTSEALAKAGAEMPPTPKLIHRPVSAVNPATFERTNETRNGADHATSETTVPVVKVTIGRVEVRALFSPPASRPPSAVTRPQALSLEDYLKSRNGGGR